MTQGRIINAQEIQFNDSAANVKEFVARFSLIIPSSPNPKYNGAYFWMGEKMWKLMD